MLNYIYKVLDNTNVMRKEDVWTGNSERKKEINENKGRGQRVELVS